MWFFFWWILPGCFWRSLFLITDKWHFGYAQDINRAYWVLCVPQPNTYRMNSNDGWACQTNHSYIQCTLMEVDGSCTTFACYLKSRSHDFCLKKINGVPLGFIHFKVSVHTSKTTPCPLLSYIIEKWIADGWGISPLGFIHYWVNVWSPWGNRVPPWASYFSHAISELMSKNRRCPPLCSYIAKNVWREGGVYKTPEELGNRVVGANPLRSPGKKIERGVNW